MAYFPKYDGGGVSLVDALDELGYNSSYAAREAIAMANGIDDYKGTRQQNTILLNKLKKGTLIKP